jgi:hypothetical protein
MRLDLITVICGSTTAKKKAKRWQANAAPNQDFVRYDTFASSMVVKDSRLIHYLHWRWSYIRN